MIQIQNKNLNSLFWVPLLLLLDYWTSRAVVVSFSLSSSSSSSPTPLLSSISSVSRIDDDDTAAAAECTTSKSKSSSSSSSTTNSVAIPSSSSPPSSSNYASNVLEWLDSETISWSFANTTHSIPFHQFVSKTSTFVVLDKSSILLHLIPTPRTLEEALPPTLNQKLTEWVAAMSSSSDDNNDNNNNDKGGCSTKYKKIIHLHQDVWIGKNEIVKSRLLVQSGQKQPNRIYGRKTLVRRINATEARSFLIENHLWSATKAKHHYGLFRKLTKEEEEEEEHAAKRGGRRRRRQQHHQQSQQEQLVAVATFSKCRKVQRGGNNNNRLYKSFELLRYCSLRDSTVVGGISKLYKKFIHDVQPDDIVTLVDRDWGEATGWHTSLPFETMSILDPLVMVVSPLEPGVRRYLVGRGLQNRNVPITSEYYLAQQAQAQQQYSSFGRLGIPENTLVALNATSDPQLALKRLAQDQLYPVYDAGVERLYMVVSNNNNSTQQRQQQQDQQDQQSTAARLLWRTAQPKYAQRYYSSNNGIFSLLEYAATRSPPLDSDVHSSNMDSWRMTSSSGRTAADSANKLIFTAQSSMDPEATIEVRQRDNGWRTMRFLGGSSSSSKTKKKVSSIYHSIFKVDPCNNNEVESEVVIQDHLKTMAVLSLAGQQQQQKNKKINNENQHDKKNRDLLRFLHFGYGAGTLVRLIAHHVRNSNHVAVELDQAVVDAAKYTLPDLPNVSIIAKDAIQFVQDYCESNNPHQDDAKRQQLQGSSGGDYCDYCHHRFDCICIDVFDENNFVPDQLYSTEFLQKLSEELLTPDGILVHNFHSGGRKRKLVIESASNAVSSVFKDVCWVPSIDSTLTGGNAILLASKLPLPEDGDGKISLSRNALRIQTKYGFTFDAVARVQPAKRAIPV